MVVFRQFEALENFVRKKNVAKHRPHAHGSSTDPSNHYSIRFQIVSCDPRAAACGVCPASRKCKRWSMVTSPTKYRSSR